MAKKEPDYARTFSEEFSNEVQKLRKEFHTAKPKHFPKVKTDKVRMPHLPKIGRRRR